MVKRQTNTSDKTRQRTKSIKNNSAVRSTANKRSRSKLVDKFEQDRHKLF